MSADIAEIRVALSAGIGPKPLQGLTRARLYDMAVTLLAAIDDRNSELDQRRTAAAESRRALALAEAALESIGTAAYRAGAEAMREAAGQHVLKWAGACNAALLREEIRALPIPEPKR